MFFQSVDDEAVTDLGIATLFVNDLLREAGKADAKLMIEIVKLGESETKPVIVGKLCLQFWAEK